MASLTRRAIDPPSAAGRTRSCYFPESRPVGCDQRLLPIRRIAAWRGPHADIATARLGPRHRHPDRRNHVRITADRAPSKPFR
jgi:hypothetical protein